MSAWAEPVAALLVILASALAVDRALVSRAHRPVAFVLCVAMLEPLRPDAGLVAKFVCIGLHALSAWLAVRVLARARLLALAAGALVFVIGASRWSDWEAAPTWAAVTSVIVQACVVLAVVPRRRLWLADRCVVALFAGDVAALLGAPTLAAWWVVQWQAAAVALVLCLLHVHQALADRRRRG